MGLCADSDTGSNANRKKIDVFRPLFQEDPGNSSSVLPVV